MSEHPKEIRFIKELLLDMPFAHYMNIELLSVENGVLLELAGTENMLGNADISAMHGGCMASLLETTAVLEAARHMVGLVKTKGQVIALPVPLSTTTQYLRGGKSGIAGSNPIATFARAEMLKHGKRSSTIVCRLWQEDEAKLLASMTAIMMQPAQKKLA